MEIEDIFEIRRAKLAALIDKQCKGNIAAFARKHEQNDTYIRQLLSEHRPFGEKSARSIEAACELPAFYLDTEGEDELSELVNLLRLLDTQDLWEVLQLVRAKSQRGGS